jgi:hypothetical protein
MAGIGGREKMSNDIRQLDLTMLSVVLGLGKDTVGSGRPETLKAVPFCIKRSEKKKC